MEVNIYEQYTEELKETIEVYLIAIFKGGVVITDKKGKRRAVDKTNEYIEFTHELISRKK